MPPRVSVIIPLHRYGPAARRCVERTVGLEGGQHETLVVSDHPVEDLPPGARALVTGSVADTSPAEKRDFAFAHSRGEILAFIDDDAWPAPDWIERALERFDSDRGIAAVGGPGVTPPDSSFAERAGGAFYESPFGSGGMRNRFTQTGSVLDTDDWPAFNLFIRRSDLSAVGGWASRFYGGEDTKLCLALVESGRRIVVDPRVVVFHARRPVFGPHMRQVHNVGRHRGWFVRAFPQTSARPVYFLPAVGVLLGPALAGWTLSGTRRRRRLGLAAAVAGWLSVSLDARRRGNDVGVAAALPLVLALGHAAYGVGFIQGLLFTETIEAM